MGVKQGGILSPNFFNLFMKELGERLVKSKTGLKIGELLIPCLLFADDILLFASNRKEVDER